MNNLTSAIDMDVLPSEYVMLTAPISTVLVSGRGLVNTILAGFAVDSIVFSSDTNSWEIDCRYATNMPNTITSPFVSKVGVKPYSNDVLDTFKISKFPCQPNDPTICCLNDYKNDYIIGGFADAITESISTCDATVQSTNTLGMFNTSLTQQFVASFMQDFPNSMVTATGLDGIHLSLHATDVQYSFSKRHDFDSGHFQLKFFLGMAYYTLLPAPVLSTMASQVEITIDISPSLVFAFSSSNEYTFVQYLTMAVYQVIHYGFTCE
jgi:hypothetical protein